MKKLSLIADFPSELAEVMNIISIQAPDKTSDKDVKIYLSSDAESLALKLAVLRGERINSESLGIAIERLENERVKVDVSSQDIILDTSTLDFGETAATVISLANQNDYGGQTAYFSEDKLNFPDDEADSELIAELSESLTENTPISGGVFYDGEMYIVSLPEATLARVLFGDGLIPIKVVDTDISCMKFVKMKNSL